MSRIAPVLKREFTEAVGTRGFLIGTILGPLLMVGMFAVQFLIARSASGEHRVVVADASGRDLGPRVKEVLETPQPPIAFIAAPTFSVEMATVAPAEREAFAAGLRDRVRAKELDGFLYIPADVTAGGTAEYEGDDATNSGAMSQVRQALQRSVQSDRLRVEGIDETRMEAVLESVKFQARRTEGGNPTVARVLAFAMAFAMYVLVIMYGQIIMQAVQEEKRDRIVELVVSSIRARDLLIGKVLALGGAGLLQMLIWVATAAFLITYSTAVAALAGADETTMAALAQAEVFPAMPPSLPLLVLAYFLGGFLLFATLFAVIGAIVTNLQEAQQYVMVIMLPFVIGFFIAMPAGQNPDSSIAVAGSIVPFTSSIVMPVRILMSNVSWLEVVASLALLFATAFAIVWLAAKVYRVAIFATGKRPSLKELIAWTRAA